MKLIADPIYDAVFKFLMEDEEVAKRFIGIIIGKNILEIHLLPQEKTYQIELPIVRILRLDFVAVIKQEDGTTSKVLIELQKSNNALHADLMRFRGYLAKQYTLDDLPIITIYLLGFVLDDKLPATIFVSREYYNLSTKEIIGLKNDFIEKLTHDCYVVQIPLLKKPLRTKVDYVLSIFDQHRVSSEDKDGRHFLIYEEEPLDKDIEMMIKRLQLAIADKELREKLEDAEFMERYYQETFGKQEKRIISLEGELEQEKQRAEQEKQRAEQKEIELEQEKQRLISAAKKLLKSGMPPASVMEVLQIDEDFLKTNDLI